MLYESRKLSLAGNDLWQFGVTRLAPLIVVIATATVLIAAIMLQPDPAGVGTHQQMGLPPCGILLTTGLPCATCGMTTAFAYAAQGRMLTAFLTQPAGAMLAILTAIGTIIGVYTLLTGLPLIPIAKCLWRPVNIGLLGGVVILSWAYKCGAMAWNV